MSRPQPIGSFAHKPYLTPAEAEALKNAAHDRYYSEPHANPLVGRERYRAEIDAINALMVEG